MPEQDLRRERFNLTIDGRVLEKMKVLAKMRDISVSRYIEEFFVNEYKRSCVLPPDFEPFKETRGGDRTKQELDDD